MRKTDEKKNEGKKPKEVPPEAAQNIDDLHGSIEAKQKSVRHPRKEEKNKEKKTKPK